MNFVLNRILQSMGVLLGVSFFTYMMIGLMPGDPIDLMVNANPYASAEDVARLKAIYGLDKPLIERYGLWLANIAQGDFGFSRLFADPVWVVIAPALKQSLILMGASLSLSLLIALPLGIVAAAKRNTIFDKAINLLSFSGISIPSFWFALMLISLFAVSFHILPAGGEPPRDASFFQSIAHYILPVAVLTFSTIGFYIRYIRSSMIEVLEENYIKTAKAKGLSKYRVLFVHGFRNAFVPILMVVALDFGNVFSGALITETLFSIQGMGKIIYDAIMGNDFNLAMMGLLIATLMVLLGNVLADLAHYLLDPRIRKRGQQ